MLDVWLLARGGMIPFSQRLLTSALVRYAGEALLIDCGEGTQLAMRDMDCPFKCISTICLTHFHADHVVGLPGLLLSIANSGREEPLLVVGPAGAREVVAAARVIAPALPYEVRVLELVEGETSFARGELAVTSFPLRHGMPCRGYAIELPRVGKFDPERAKAAGVPVRLWSALQKCPSAELDGEVYTSDMVLGPKRRGLKIVYCTDTLPDQTIALHARDADLAILEGMYGDSEPPESAYKHAHMTMLDAAKLARDAGARRLWLTHYSPAERTPEESAASAREVFPELDASERGLFISLRFDE